MKETIVHAIQDDYADEFSWCYGCGRLNEHGHHFRTGWDGNRTVTYYEPKKEHMAVPWICIRWFDRFIDRLP